MSKQFRDHDQDTILEQFDAASPQPLPKKTLETPTIEINRLGRSYLVRCLDGSAVTMLRLSEDEQFKVVQRGGVWILKKVKVAS